MNCSVERKDVNTFVIRAPTSQNANKGLDALVGHTLNVEWEFERGLYRHGDWSKYVKFRWGEPLLTLPCNDAPATVKITFHDHILYQQRVEAPP